MIGASRVRANRSNVWIMTRKSLRGRSFDTVVPDGRSMFHASAGGPGGVLLVVLRGAAAVFFGASRVAERSFDLGFGAGLGG